jgi:hypothetical protein
VVQVTDNHFSGTRQYHAGLKKKSKTQSNWMQMCSWSLNRKYQVQYKLPIRSTPYFDNRAPHKWGSLCYTSTTNLTHDMQWIHVYDVPNMS